MKPRYPILDGLRGTASILVVCYHLFSAYFRTADRHPIHHGYLAVDFFFLLSGFVVGYAYDDRWVKMSVVEFFKIRLIRLHPLVILGMIVGALCFWFDPFTLGASFTSIGKLLIVTFLGFIMMPAPDIRGWREIFPTNAPCWSLLQEYLANILYALIGRRLSKTALWVVVLVSGLALVVAAVWHGDVASGWSLRTFWFAFIRMLFPFSAGLLLYRTGKRIKIPNAYLFCSLLLIILFCLPIFKFNGLYEAACILFAFPLIVAAAAGGEIDGRWAKICNFSGEISYPIYILHYPFIYILTAWVTKKNPAPMTIVPIAIGLFFFLILLAYAALKLYDEPVRAWLKKKYLSPRPITKLA